MQHQPGWICGSPVGAHTKHGNGDSHTPAELDEYQGSTREFGRNVQHLVKVIRPQKQGLDGGTGRHPRLKIS